MNQALAGVLESLKLPDGRLDAPARQQAIDGLIETLTKEEIRYFRKRLNRFSWCKDIFISLPVELQRHIAQHLDLEDIFRVRSVSRAWHRAFTGKELCLDLFTKHVPWLPLEEPVSGTDDQVYHDSDAAKYHQYVLMRRLKRLHGCYDSNALYAYDPRVFDISTLSPPQYCRGRIAYLVNGYTVVVHCLQTHAVTTFLEPQRRFIEMWCLADEYLMMTTKSRGNLHAFSLLTEGEVHTILLPSVPIKVSGKGRRVGVILQHELPMLWMIGGQLTSLSLSKPNLSCDLPAKAECHVVFAHDLENFCVSRVFYDKPLQADTFIYIVLDIYEKETIPATYEFQALYVASWFNSQPERAGNLLVWNFSPGAEYHKCQHQESTFTTEHCETLEFVIFDIKKRKFDYQTYHVPSTIISGLQPATVIYTFLSCFWRGQLILPITVDDGTDGIPREQCAGKLLAMGVNACDNAVLLSQRLSTISESKYLLPLQKNLWRSLGCAWYWITDDETLNTAYSLGMGDEDNENLEEEQLHLAFQGDDDYMVLFGSRFGYRVWSFDPARRLSSA